MPNTYKVIDEKNWNRAMHCAVFRNSIEPALGEKDNATHR